MFARTDDRRAIRFLGRENRGCRERRHATGRRRANELTTRKVRKSHRHISGLNGASRP
jgi:hypothetical protein